MPDERRIVVYNDITGIPPDVHVGEVLPMYRAGGPRDGDLYAYATVTAIGPEGIDFDAEPV